MEAARVAALRGHEVTLCDKSPKLGGLVPVAAIVKERELDALVEIMRYYENSSQTRCHPESRGNG